LKLINKIGYGFGNLAISITYFAVNFFYLYYLNIYTGIHIAIAGLIIFAGRMIDTVISPFIGILSDSISIKTGTKKAFIIIGSVPYGLSFFLLWIVPYGIGEIHKILLALASFCFHCIIFSFINVSYKSLVPAITDDYEIRSSLNIFRTIFSLLGIIIGGMVKIFINLFDNINTGLMIMGSTFGTIVALSSLIPVFMIHEQKSDLNKKFSLNDLSMILKDEPFIILLRMFIFSTVAMMALISSLTFFCHSILYKDSFVILLIFILSGIFGIPVIRRFEKYFEKKDIFIFTVISASFVILMLSIFLNSHLYIFFMIATFIVGLLMSAYHLYPYSLLPDVINHFEAENNKRYEAVFYGIWIFINNSAGAVGILLTSFIIWLGEMFFNRKIGVRLSFGVLTFVFFIIGMLLLVKYPINREKYEGLIKKNLKK